MDSSRFERVSRRHRAPSPEVPGKARSDQGCCQHEHQHRGQVHRRRERLVGDDNRCAPHVKSVDTPRDRDHRRPQALAHHCHREVRVARAQLHGARVVGRTGCGGGQELALGIIRAADQDRDVLDRCWGGPSRVDESGRDQVGPGPAAPRRSDFTRIKRAFHTSSVCNSSRRRPPCAWILQARRR